ncbi:MAG: hypothetical protein ACTFAL_16960 [Candidatus Electronema sp. V4]|uniref:hypothetical protein n=1 Tax=Candidatus Electronema sp. V4 TaxID=3454756 RepID=UPI004055507E
MVAEEQDNVAGLELVGYDFAPKRDMSKETPSQPRSKARSVTSGPQSFSIVEFLLEIAQRPAELVEAPPSSQKDTSSLSSPAT